jgi:nucleoside-diphosphate-sugar epimerase
MRIFVTGATGFIGSAVVKELQQAGHQVSGLTRTPAGAAKLQALGATAHVGTLNNFELLHQAAAASDGVIHTAFIHGFQHMNLGTRLRLFGGALTRGIMGSFMNTLVVTETRAVEALGSALKGTGKPLVVTSGILNLPQGRVSTEMDSHVGMPSRAFSESAAFSFVPMGVRACVVRLPPSVHGAGDYGFVPMIIKAARKKRTSAYIGDGANHWPAVHRLDAARLFRLVAEKGEAGAKYHGVAEAGIPFQNIAKKIASHLQLPTSSCTAKDAAKHFGFLSPFIGLGNPSSSEWTQQKLGWQPEHPTLFEDMDQPDYFAEK